MRVHLLGGPWIALDSLPHEIPDGSKRLLAFLSLDRRRLDRRYVAGTLWPESDDERAGGSLRTALWRLGQVGLDVVEIQKLTIRLNPCVRVDVDEIRTWASRLLTGDNWCDDLRCFWEKLDGLDILPGWYEDWVLVRREGLRQLLMYAFDELGGRLTDRGRHAEAVTIAQHCVDIDPLRESAQEVLIKAHLAAGNLVEAHRALTNYERLLLQELGARPRDGLYALPRLLNLRRTK